jgi:hypothetical protein
MCVFNNECIILNRKYIIICFVYGLFGVSLFVVVFVV